MTGRFITLEGIDGAGKTTQIRALAERLRNSGQRVIETREPGGSPGAEAIRKLLVEGCVDRWSAESEILLFTAARRDHLERVIAPALARGETVLCDRFADSTRVYQGAVRGDLRAFVDALHERAIGVEPDITLILDIEPAVARARGLTRGPGEDRFERFGLAFQTRLRTGFLDLAQEFPRRCQVVAAGDDAEAIAARIADAAAPV
jgi:dTMP kinase